MNQLMAPDQLEKANNFRRLWALYQQNKDLIQVGAYEKGTNPELDEAIQKRPLFEDLCGRMPPNGLTSMPLKLL